MHIITGFMHHSSSWEGFFFRSYWITCWRFQDCIQLNVRNFDTSVYSKVLSALGWLWFVLAFLGWFRAAVTWDALLFDLFFFDLLPGSLIFMHDSPKRMVSINLFDRSYVFNDVWPAFWTGQVSSFFILILSWYSVYTKSGIYTGFV